MADSQEVIELLDDSASDSVEFLSSRNNNDAGSQHPPRVLLVNNPSSTVAGLPSSFGSTDHGVVNQNKGQHGAASNQASTNVRKEGSSKDAAFVCLSSDDSDILSIHTHVMLSSGDEVIEDVSVIQISTDSSSFSDDDEESEDKSIPGRSEIRAKMGPRKTPFLGKLPRSITVAGAKRGRDFIAHESPHTKRSARSAIGFDPPGVPLVSCQNCSRLFSKGTIGDHEIICGKKRPPEETHSVAQVAGYPPDKIGSVSRLPTPRDDMSHRELAPLEEEQWKQNIQSALLQTQEEDDKKRAEILREGLRSKNEMLLSSKPKRFELNQCLSAPVDSIMLDSALLKEPDHPVPEDNVTTIFLQKNFGEFGDEAKSSIEKEQSNNNSKETVTYESVMSSFQEMLCTRCLIYDCGLHGSVNPYSSDLAAEVAMKKEKSGFWKDKAPLICLPLVSSTQQDFSLSKEQEVLAERLCFIYENDLDKVALALGVPKLAIQKHVTLQEFEFKHVKKNEDLSLFHCVKGNKQKRRMRILYAQHSSKPTRRDMFIPCRHTERCKEETCTCVQNGYPCTNHCIWGPLSRNFFPGCNCQTKCLTRSCPCFAAGRECDPDRCRSCLTCTDPPGLRQDMKQLCRNDNVRMRRHKHLLLAKSTIEGAGWGLFCKTKLQKGEYIHEYLGEVIEDDVAEARAQQNDKDNRNYIFENSRDYCIDGLRKSNKTRYMNHKNAKKANVKVKNILVDGDPRIAFFAKKDIPAQTEKPEAAQKPKAATKTRGKKRGIA
eukprot:scaffold22596_cov131-Cylindrotheca_fusiformis.AAC.9